MNKVNLKFRTWYKGRQPQRIKLKKEWAGDHISDSPTPVMCKPWIDGSCYGLELVYPFETECRVTAVDGVCTFQADFSKEKEKNPVDFSHWEIPFSAFAPDHFGFTSSVDIKTEDGFGTMILPHPRYYTDRTGTVPCPVMGFLESDWWPKIFFIVFKAPLNGQEYIFRNGEPYASLLILPKKVQYNIQKMTVQEETERALLDHMLRENAKKIATHTFIDSRKQPFDNKYKILSTTARDHGLEAVKNQIVNPILKKSIKIKKYWRKKS